MATQLGFQARITHGRRQPSGSQKSLWDMLDQKDRGIIDFAPHQRDDAWGDEKKAAWNHRLIKAYKGEMPLPSGAMTTYEIVDGGPSGIWLNDGSQRHRASKQLLERPGLYDETPALVEDVLRSIEITVEHRHYYSHDEAAVDFQLINLGTQLTAYEHFISILIYMPEYESKWRAVTDRVHTIVHENAARVLAGKYLRYNREQEQIFKRNNYVLFRRFLSGEKDLSHVEDGKVAQTKIKPAEISDKKKTVEWSLRDTLIQTGTSRIDNELEKFAQFVKRETATLMDTWKEAKRIENAGISPTMYRWILGTAIWKRNNKQDNVSWETFLLSLLSYTQGQTQFSDPENPMIRTTLSLGKGNSLRTVCQILRSDFYIGRPARQYDTTYEPLPGFDRSHTVPFVTNGDGPVVFEPASRNRARGAKPIEQKAE